VYKQHLMILKSALLAQTIYFDVKDVKLHCKILGSQIQIENVPENWRESHDL
jgi:hypothetical protein